MPTPDSTPFTDAPFALKALWHKFALRGELAPHSPPATVREAYTQVVAVQLKEMHETMEAIEVWMILDERFQKDPLVEQWWREEYSRGDEKIPWKRWKELKL